MKSDELEIARILHLKSEIKKLKLDDPRSKDGSSRMVQSMSRRANCRDNAAMESIFKTMKVERVYRTRYETRAQAKLDIVDWIEGFYNRRRIHSSIDYQTPVGVESLLRTA